MWMHPDRPYQDLPPLPPAHMVETRAVLKATVSASRALARLDGACKRLPDPTMLINIVPLMEAQASNEIENIVTTNDELFRAAHGAIAHETPQVKEALRYREALRAGFASLSRRPITTSTALEICSHIHGRPARIRDTTGTYIGDPVRGTRLYTPPEGKAVIEKHLSAWEKFIHAQHGLDPLIVLALAHYQFEAIHPFYDGNGRTGRVLNILMLIEAELLELPILYLSGYILRHKDDYYAKLNAVTRDDAWEPWILFMLAGIESTATWTLNLVEKADDVKTEMETNLRAAFPKYPIVELTRVMFTQPYLRIEDVVNANLAQRQTASRWLSDIAERGFLTKQRVGRNVIFVNDRLLTMLFGMPLVD
ncbi:Fic family protein [Actinotignum urinale]|uniref:Fic family protein n=1 Tax=Actinotignum urinale TaxID=190146 RepID=UPI00047B944E|nr:Fic family protein [Actinotignum urinale]MDY5128484.1 Fic family protein [Actinotignum urinale]MDY5160573.1 Fic family protein [Actinotignum urinale]